MPDWQRLEKVREVLASFGFNPSDPSYEKTAERWIKMMREFTTPEDFEFTVFPNKGANRTTQMVIVKGIKFSSLCAHHCLPYHGEANIGYIPSEYIVGVSKIPRIVKYYSKFPTEQENFAQTLLDQMQERLTPLGVIVHVEAVHTCMMCRGIESDAKLVSCVANGILINNPYAKQEFVAWVSK